MVISEKVPVIKRLLISTAKRKGTASYPDVFRLFPNDIDKPSIFWTLEAACKEVCPRDIALYDSLMAKKGTGMPGDGFFDVFRNMRRREYSRISNGEERIVYLTDEQKKEIVLLERRRVYDHASLL
jgi:hypothetical protein